MKSGRGLGGYSHLKFDMEGIKIWEGFTHNSLLPLQVPRCVSNIVLIV